MVIESDDWGSLRTVDRQAKNRLKRINDESNVNPYVNFDSIAQEDDLTHLFDVLGAFKDKNGHVAKLTANTCVANPDFDKIKKAGFVSFHYQSIKDSLQTYSYKGDLFKLWTSGIDDGVFTPQLHGREHLHALMWLKELRSNQPELREAFECRAWGIPYTATNGQRRNNLQAALDLYGLEGEDEFQKNWLKDSQAIFKSTFGYESKTFIAPTYVWSNKWNPLFEEENIHGLQGIKLQYDPKYSKMPYYKKRIRYTGQKEDGIFYLTRNSFFEPSIYPQKNWEQECLKGISEAFTNGQPAILGSHRINYIGSLSEKNRRDNLSTLRSILKNVINKWPDVEFMSSAELLEIIDKGQHN